MADCAVTVENLEKYVSDCRQKFETQANSFIGTDFESGPQTTVIHGNNSWETCYRHACYLAKYIYSQRNNPKFYSEYPEKMKEVEENWQEWDFLEDNSGLMGALYKQKNDDPESKQARCPPILVFRGTDMEDFRGLAALVRFKVSKGLWWTFLYPWTAESGVYVKDWDRKDFTKAGYKEHLLYKEEGRFSGLLWKVFKHGTGTTININTKIELYIYTKDGFGDWNNNFTQGMGKGSKQYERAIEFGRDIVEEKIISAEDKRLEITGHSLGGGLAAATCCVLNEEYPKITVHSIIFNAAGVHEKTIEAALKDKNKVSGAMSCNPCIDICVQDEILTTLGAHYPKLPFLGAIFTYVSRQIGQYGLPNPSNIAVLRDIPGYSPGTVSQTAKQKVDMESLPDRMRPILEADTAEADRELREEMRKRRISGRKSDESSRRKIHRLRRRIERNKKLMEGLEQNKRDHVELNEANVKLNKAKLHHAQLLQNAVLQDGIYQDKAQLHQLLQLESNIAAAKQEIAEAEQEKDKHLEDSMQRINDIFDAEARRQQKTLEEELKHAQKILAAEASKLEMPAKGEALKKLFPIQEQNAVPMPKPDGFPLITAIDNLLSPCHDANTFITNFLSFLNDHYGAEARRQNRTPIGSYKDIIENFMEDIKPELKVVELLMGLSSEYHGMDVVIASYEHKLREHKTRAFF